MHYTAIRSLLLILPRFIGLPRFSYPPPHTNAYQHIPNACHPMQLYFGYQSICYHQLKYYSMKLTAQLYIDTISQTTKIPSLYVLNRIAIGTVRDAPFDIWGGGGLVFLLLANFFFYLRWKTRFFLAINVRQFFFMLWRRNFL